jgi:hypothetical protein
MKHSYFFDDDINTLKIEEEESLYWFGFGWLVKLFTLMPLLLEVFAEGGNIPLDPLTEAVKLAVCILF